MGTGEHSAGKPASQRQAVFMGTPDFASGILEALIQSEYHVMAVFTQPDRPKGRGKGVQFSPVKETAMRHGIEVFQPVRIRQEENVELLRRLRPDFIVVAAFGQIIPQAILDIPPYGCLNVHASLLPAWRGAAPIQWSIISGDTKTGVTIMKMNAGLDTGDIISQEAVRIREDETGGSLFDRLMPVGAELLLRTMREIEAGRAVLKPQPEKSTTPYASMLTKKSGLVDWTKRADEIERMIRGLSPWPSAYTFEHGKMLKIWKAEVVRPVTDVEAASDREQENLHPAAGQKLYAQGKDAVQEAAWDGKDAAPNGAGAGTIVRVTKTELVVQTGYGQLSLLELQPEGKKRMAVDAFLRGYRQSEGERLGY
ncbi:MAG: methionyl-tRNA formyltransferase [Lachnospiraceae bacterium]|nr:methionyl-tRNA formyltransferase [Lachnospiraceae bacterium]